MRGRGWRHRALGVAGATLVLAALGAGTAGASVAGRARPSVTPIIECSLARGSRTQTLYGYDNTGPAVTLGVGPANRFSPGPADRGQPQTFQRGTRVNVFSLDAAGPVTWTLGNGRVRAPGPSCQSTPTDSALARWGPIGAIVIVTAVLGTLLFWRSRRYRTAAA